MKCGWSEEEEKLRQNVVKVFFYGRLRLKLVAEVIKREMCLRAWILRC